MLVSGVGGRVWDQHCTEYYNAAVLHKNHHEQLTVLADPFEGRKSELFCLNFPNQYFVMIFCDTRSKKILNDEWYVFIKLAITVEPLP